MEVISRAEEYLNYALKNQDNYPEPISRMDYYLLSVAQEVRAGSDIDGGTFEESFIKVTNISLNYSAYSLAIGDTVQLSAFVEPSDATDQTITWSCNNSNVSVSETGLVTAKTIGSSIITATSSNSSVVATCTITIAEEVNNLFDKDDTYTDKYINASGVLVSDSSSNYNRTYDKHYEVSAGQTVTLSIADEMKTKYGLCIAIYKEDGTFISRTKINDKSTNQISIVMPEEASYVIIGICTAKSAEGDYTWDDVINTVVLTIE